jgi:hypothetical protein
VGHFQNPPTYDSGWVNITDKCGQHFALNHDLNTTEVVVDITGKQSIAPEEGALAWSRPYGGADWDRTGAMVRTSDGGYVMAGQTNSSGAGDDDFWLVKIDASGNMQWSRTYGGADNDEAYSVVQTADGGYAIAGHTYSYGAGYADFWLVKTDTYGNVQWTETYGDALAGESATGVVQTSDGGYAIAGWQTIYPALSDFWLVKTDASGNMQWNKTYDDSGRQDNPTGFVQTSDGGYAIAGYSGSLMLDDVTDFRLVKTDPSGEAQWNKTYSGATWDFAYGVIQTRDGGYAIAGGTRPEPDPLSHAVLLVKTDQTGNMVWNRTCGGAIHDHAFSVIQTSDGGYTMTGFNSADAEEVYSDTDVLLVRTNSVGDTVWNRTYGGAQVDVAYSVVQTGDGGYALVGVTTSFGSGEYDAWLVKVRAEMNLEHQRHLGGTGNIPGWTRTYGAATDEVAYSMVQTADGGYALAGYKTAATLDLWFVKTDWSGNLLWDVVYGGNQNEVAYAVVQAVDGGYAIAGYTRSSGAGQDDFYLVKIDSAGNIAWNKTYGGSDNEVGYCIVETLDGGYALAGYTNSFGIGSNDFWLVKTNSTGDHLWNQTFGGSSSDIASHLVQTSDGGYALAGYTYSFDADLKDFYLVKTDAAGNILWNKTYGGASYEEALSLVATSDGGFALVGYTNPPLSADYDVWLIKTDPSGNVEWNKTYGGPNIDRGHSVVQTADGGYAIVCRTNSFGAGGTDVWLIKTDAYGNMQWSRRYGEANLDDPWSVVATSDGGYAMAGPTYSLGIGNWDFRLVKTDSEMGLTLTALSNTTINLYRGSTDLDWNYVRVRMWMIEEPTWIFGDINMDGVVDAKDLAIVGRNYGSTFSLLSLTGILGILGVHTYKARKRPE